MPRDLRQGAALFLTLAAAVQAQTYISEVLFNPPGPDAPNQYVELRGRPNTLLSNGTYFVAVNGDAAADPGTVCDVFDLSGRAIGGNGFLLLLQNSNRYAAHSYATVLANTNGPGWGSGASSSVGHRGSTELPHASLTFLLLETADPPAIDLDLDTDNNGVPDGTAWAGWRVLDSVGVLDDDGAGDIAYGRINYRRNTAPGNGATASGVIVPIAFTPAYVARAGHTTNYAAAGWVAGDNLQGSAPNWRLSDSTTTPSTYDLEPLNHLGGPNFGASPLPGVVAVTPPSGFWLREGGSSATYQLGLNTVPSGAITVQVTTDYPLQVSNTVSQTWGSSRSVTFSGTGLQTVTVRANHDGLLDTTPHIRLLRHQVTVSADPTRYPVGIPAPLVRAAVTDTEFLLLSELKVNPPGTNEGPWEYVEILGNPSTLLTNVYFLSLESAGTKDPGKVNLVVNLTSARLGSSGLLVIGSASNPYSVPLSATLLGDARFDLPGGALGNGSRSFLLVSSPKPIAEGVDLDGGDNGILEGLPAGTTVLDAVAWSDGGAGDVLYGPPLNMDTGLPQAALRFPGDRTANTTNAWLYGDLAGTSGASLDFDPDDVSINFPLGTRLTPGTLNNTAPAVTGLPPLSGVIGDPTNPNVTFTVADPETPPNLLQVSATSANQAVVANTNLLLTDGGNGQWTLTIVPTGVGYTLITIWAGDGTMTGYAAFRYAASEMGRPGGFFHTYVCDASTAFPIDTNLMFIGDDEKQTIGLYRRGQSGAPLAAFDFTVYLNLTEFYDDGRPKEVDIEGSTRVGNRIFWIGSESNAEWGDPHPNRNRVFATDLSGTGTNSHLAYVGRYEHLKEDILDWDANNRHGKGSNYYGLVASAAAGVNPKAGDGSGYNIEGLTMAPGSAHRAYIGLRAPFVPTTNRAKALLLVITNFSTLATNGGNAGATRFGAPIELNLTHRGIRAMTTTPDGILIVAGPPGPASEVPPDDFKLFTWTGNSADRPQERAADLTGLSPEGIVEVSPGPFTSNTVVELISDNGVTVYYGDGIPAKKLEEPAFKKFRSDRVVLGPVVVPRPIIRSLPTAASSWVLSWYASEGLTYTVQWATTLQPANWRDLPGDVTATEATASKTVPAPTTPQCFYRVVVR